MNKDYRKKEKVNKGDNEVERILEITWKNWASRRACERTHIPEYIKRQKKREN